MFIIQQKKTNISVKYEVNREHVWEATLMISAISTSFPFSDWILSSSTYKMEFLKVKQTTQIYTLHYIVSLKTRILKHKIPKSK